MITNGKALHTAGAADAIRQSLALTSGAWYRGRFAVSGRMAGQGKVQRSGGSEPDGQVVAANGLVYDRIQAVTGNAAFGFVADIDFDGSVDGAVLFLETSGCIDAGDDDYDLEMQNEDGVPSLVSGPFSTGII